MSQFASVKSIDALSDFKAALVEFADVSKLALSEAQSDAQRTIWWLTRDQPSHWQREVKKRSEKLSQAKVDLARAQLAAQDVRASAALERKAVAAAQARLEEAERKLAACKRWTQVLEREFMLFKAQCQQVASACAADVPMAVARIERMIDSLQAYISLAPPSDATPVSPPVTEDSQPSEGGTS